MPVQIRFVNYSNDSTNSSVVIFQTGMRGGQTAVVAAYRIDNCGPGSSHVIPRDFGNDHTIRIGETELISLPVFALRQPGNYTVVCADEGHHLSGEESGEEQYALTVRNESAEKTVYVTIERGSFAVIDKHPLTAGGTISILSEPNIFVGRTPAEQREVMEDPAMLNALDGFSLAGISTADLVMRGDGSTTPFFFALENIAK